MDSLDGMKSGILKLGTVIGTVFSIKALIDFGKKAVEASAEINASNSQLQQTFGSLQASAENAMQRVADASGIVKTRLQGIGTSIYAFAKTSGMESAKALEMMEEALNVAADSAAYYDRSLEETSESLKSFLKGNFENDAALGLSCTETTRNITANKLYGKSFQELSESQKQLTLLQMVKDANALSGAMGQAARESDGLENVLGNLKETWKQLLAVVGQPILKLTISIIKQLTATLTTLTEYAKSTINALSNVFGGQSNQNSSVSFSNEEKNEENLLDDTSSVTDEIADSVNNQNELTEAVEETARAEEKSLAGFDEINTITDNTEIEIQPETVEDTDIIPAQTVEIEPVLTDSVEVTADTDPFETAMAEALGRIKSLLDKLLEPVKIAWDVNGNELVSSAESAVSKIKELIKSIGQSFIDVWTNGTGERYVSNIIILLTDIFNIIGDIAEAFRNAWNDNGTGEALIQSYFDRWNAVLELLHAIAEAFRNVWNNGTGETFIKNILVLFTDIFNIIGEITMALQTAWNDNGTGEALIQSYFDRWNNLLELIHTLADDFREVWNNGTGVEVCTNIFEIVTNINETIASLRKRFELAWKENDTGKGIIQSILDIFNIILGTINDITADTEEWSEKLDFSPLLTAIQGLLESLEPLTENIGSGLEWFYKNVLLPLADWTIEDVIPAFIDLLSGAVDIFNSVLEVFRPLAEWLWDNFLKPIAEWTGGIIVTVIEGIANALKGISDWISEHQEGVTNFLKFAGIFTAILAISKIVQTAVAAFTAMGGILGLVTGAATLLAPVISALSGVISLLINPITLVIAIGLLLITHWDEVKEAAINAWDNITSKFQSAVDSIKEIFGNIGEWFSERWNDIVAVFSIAGEWFKAVFSIAWEQIKNSWSDVINWFSVLWIGIKEIFSIVSDWFKSMFSKAWENIRTAWNSTVKWFSDIWDNIKKTFSKVGEWFKEKFQKAWDNITEIFSSIGNWFSDRWKEIKNIFHSVGEWFGERFRNARDNIADIFSGIGNWFSDRWKDITTALSDVGDWFRDKFQNAWDNITDIFSGIGNWFSDRWNDITTVLSDVGEWFWERFQTARNNVTGIFSDIGNWFSNRWNDITAIFGGVGDWFSEKFSSAYDGITSIFSSIGDFFGGIWSNISDGAKEGVNWIIDIINGLVFSAESAVNFIIDCINSLSFDIPDFVPGIGGTHVGFDIPWVDIPDIPHLAKGTVVPANYGEFLAVLGDNKKEREFVAPESALKNALFEAMSQINNTQGDIVVNVSMFPGERAFQQYIIKAGRNIQSRGGKIF